MSGALDEGMPPKLRRTGRLRIPSAHALLGDPFEISRIESGRHEMIFRYSPQGVSRHDHAEMHPRAEERSITLLLQSTGGGLQVLETRTV